MINGNKEIDKEIIEDFECHFYGAIDKINEENIDARIYDIKTHDFVDSITFDITEFSIEDQHQLVENVVFTWDIGSKNNNAYSVFKLMKRKVLTEEEKNKKEKDKQNTIEFFDSLNVNK